jgi:hypothetical protein
MDAFDLEAKNRKQEEKDFFIVHGYWPETAQVTERSEISFTTHGLKTTIILEKASLAEESCDEENGQGRYNKRTK